MIVRDAMATLRAESRLFRKVPARTLEALEGISEVVVFPGGATLVAQGEINERLYILLKGRVRIFAYNEYILELKRLGDLVGEMSIISGNPCTASVVCEGEVEAVAVDAAAIQENEELESLMYRLFSLVLTEKLEMATRTVQGLEGLALKLSGLSHL